MHIALYTLALTRTAAEHDIDFVNGILNEHFCPIFVLHGAIDTLALCEDRMIVDADTVIFRHYENFVRSERSREFAVTIQEIGDLDQKIDMIEKIMRVIDESNGGPIVLIDYF